LTKGHEVDPEESGRAEVGSGTNADLVSAPVMKRAAALALENHLEPGTRSAGGTAESGTERAVKALAATDGDGWASGKALRDAHRTWNEQVTKLMNRLGAEKTALRGTARLYTGADRAVGNGLRLVSPLDSF